MIVRPYGLLLQGKVEFGLELVIDAGIVREIRPHTGPHEDFLVSAPFVNAHSHLEYRDLLGTLDDHLDFFSWLRALAGMKPAQTQLEHWCGVAAQENVATGVLTIGEHSDRPFAGAALRQVGIRGRIFQEVISFNDWKHPEPLLSARREDAARQQEEFSGPCAVSPHAPYTCDEGTLRQFQGPISIHVAEPPDETLWIRDGTGAIAEWRKAKGLPEARARSSVAYLQELGLVRQDVQFVHCCDVDDADIECLAQSKVRVAHCPRSNVRLGCTLAPVRRMAEAGIQVGIGLDSVASSGPIDMFAEMRSAWVTSQDKGEPISPEDVWRMAQNAQSIPGLKEWDPAQLFERLAVTGQHPEGGLEAKYLIAIHLSGCGGTADVVERAQPSHVSWLNYNRT